MSRKVILQLGQIWPDGSRDNAYWVGMDPMHARIQHCGKPLILGRECRSLAELECVAAEIREALDKVLQEARQKFRQEAK